MNSLQTAKDFFFCIWPTSNYQSDAASGSFQNRPSTIMHSFCFRCQNELWWARERRGTATNWQKEHYKEKEREKKSRKCYFSYSWVSLLPCAFSWLVIRAPSRKITESFCLHFSSASFLYLIHLCTPVVKGDLLIKVCASTVTLGNMCSYFLY